MSVTKKTFNDRVISVQSELKAPKGQYNTFGRYAYRSAEDILEAVKPLLAKHQLSLFVSDKVHDNHIGSYIETTVELSDGESQVSVTAQAGIDPNRKGMDIAQSYGSSASYARKYALNGLFLIDDTKDADAINTHGNKPEAAAAPRTSSDTNSFKQSIEYIKAAKSKGQKETAYKAVMSKYGDAFSEKQKEAIGKFLK
tara:strand:- start:2837 stop:3430 length:594 start_codon:yes stop_codon:yes gene_type:complete